MPKAFFINVLKKIFVNFTEVYQYTARKKSEKTTQNVGRKMSDLCRRIKTSPQNSGFESALRKISFFKNSTLYRQREVAPKQHHFRFFSAR
jgi:hypothetical protein